MVLRRYAHEIIDPETEAHYNVLTLLPGATHHRRITTILHDHDFYELFLITEGRLTHLINNNEVILETGDLVFIRPRDQHCYRQINGEDSHLINLAFPSHTLTDLFTYLGEGFAPARLLDAELPPTLHLQDKAQHEILSRLNQLNNIPHIEKSRIRTQLRLVLAELLGRFFTHEPASNGVGTVSWFQELCQQMKQPHNLREGVPQMRRIAHTSAEHLSRTFRKQLDCTPTEYVNDLRLTVAANLLIHSDRPIVDISLEVGYDNLSYFYRIFKQRYRLTPARFRSQNHKQSIL